MKRYIVCLLWLLLFSCVSHGFLIRAEAAEPFSAEDESDSLLGDFNFDAIQNFLDQTPEGTGVPITFTELLKQLMKGDFEGVFHQCFVTLKTSLFGEITKNGRWMGQVILLGLIGAVFANFSGIFTGSQISETGFYVTYLLMFTFLASSCYTAISITQEILSNILGFMRALVPTYFLAVSFTGGSIASAAGCGFMLFSINGVEWLFLRLLLPAVRIYVLFVLTGHLMKENIFSRMISLLENGIRWAVKTAAGLVLGFHLLQSMVLPYADSLKNTSVRRFLAVVPGIGQGAEAISQLVLGSGVLIKNTIGAGAVIVLLIICLIPLVKLAVLLLFYQGAAALLEPVCDKRMVSCISSVGTGCGLLLRMSVSALILFSVSLAVVCMASNVTYYAG